jgi:hypothetical protein
VGDRPVEAAAVGLESASRDGILRRVVLERARSTARRCRYGASIVHEPEVGVEPAGRERGRSASAESAAEVELPRHCDRRKLHSAAEGQRAWASRRRRRRGPCEGSRGILILKETAIHDYRLGARARRSRAADPAS